MLHNPNYITFKNVNTFPQIAPCHILTQVPDPRYDVNTNYMTEKLHSLKEVAGILRVSDRSVFRYIHSGKLRATKIGYWRISESDLKKFLADNTNVESKSKKLSKKNQ